MKIISVQCHLLTVPLKMTAVAATINKWTTALVEVQTDDGVSGLGECYAGFGAPGAIRALVELFAELLVGEDATRVSYLHEKMK
jgi:L-alanine-DL-glutamate epimerase-like enolase superfamily enzyme